MKRRGRDAAGSPCPAAAAAEVIGIPVHATADVNAPGSLAAIHGRRPDLLVVVAFGQILRREVMALPRIGAVNLHFSLLPRWRGAAPVQRAIEAGDETTGVTVQRIAAKLDSGAVVARREVPVLSDERAGELEARLADLGAALLTEVVAHTAETGDLIRGKPQDETLVSVARKVMADEGRARFVQTPEAFCWKARALHPWPLVSAEVTSGKRKPETVSFHRVAPGKPSGVEAEPGTVLAAGKAGVEIACGGGSVLLTEMQRAGGKVLAAEAFLNGFPLKPGDLFS